MKLTTSAKMPMLSISGTLPPPLPPTQINKLDDTVIILPCGGLKGVVCFDRVTFVFQTELTTKTASLMWSTIIALQWFSKKQIRNLSLNIFFKNKQGCVRACYKLHRLESKLIKVCAWNPTGNYSVFPRLMWLLFYFLSSL